MKFDSDEENREKKSFPLDEFQWKAVSQGVVRIFIGQNPMAVH